MDEPTKLQTRVFQRINGLDPTGDPDLKTIAAAQRFGFQGEVLAPPTGYRSKPITIHLPYTPTPTEMNPEAVSVPPSWVRDNITTVAVPPYLKHVKYIGTTVSFHKDVAQAWLDLMNDLHRNQLTDLILEWGGSWAPRFVRGSKKTLSNHSYGFAFDINQSRNALGTRGAPFGSPLTVRPLVAIAFDHGWWWGGWWSSRPDPMHFQYGIEPA